MFGFRFLSVAATVICLGSIDALSAEDKSGLKAALHPYLMECVEEFGVTEEQFEEAKKKGNAANIDPCFISCFLKKAKFFDGAGKLDVEHTISFAKSNLKGEEAITFFEAVGSECVKINDEDVSDGTDGCDRAKLLFDCITELKKKINYED